MKISYSVENLRRISSSPMIELKPITILVGRNSVGKSTLARTFPLIRQSIETSASAPILWFGDYVDFGNFTSAVKDNSKEENITFCFSIDDYHYNSSKNDHVPFFRTRTRRRNSHVENATISFSISGDEERTFLKNTSISWGNNKLSISDIESFENTDLEINGQSFDTISSRHLLLFREKNIFSEPTFARRFSDNGDDELIEIASERLFYILLQRQLKMNVTDGRLKSTTFRRETNRILNLEEFNTSSIRELRKSSQTDAFWNFYDNLLRNKNNNTLKKIEFIYLLRQGINLYTAAIKDLEEVFRSSDYIGPARARGERYYRQQELEVSEISPDGRNLPMFLSSLPNYIRLDFSNWVDGIFGFGVDVDRTGGHISIILTKNGQRVNLTDTGYGVSQVLPVLAQTWWKKREKKFTAVSDKKSSPPFQPLIIEQPELHLHPAHQALLADIFCDAIARDTSNNEVTFIIETHSEALINRLGEIVASGRVNKDDIQIIIFSDSEPTSGDSFVSIEKENIETSTFTEDGLLTNWPHGFFNYE